MTRKATEGQEDYEGLERYGRARIKKQQTAKLLGGMQCRSYGAKRHSARHQHS